MIEGRKGYLVLKENEEAREIVVCLGSRASLVHQDLQVGS